MEYDAIVHNFLGEKISLSKLRFFFIFCPNNSGTTILSQYFSSQIGGYLPPFGNNEGQMAPAVTRMMRTRPWDENQKFDWCFIREQWERLAGGDMFVEASPPNLTRIEDIKSVFGSDSSALISICNPYQHISSAFRRYSNSPVMVARHWVRKARRIAKIRQAYPFFSFLPYENFVENPQVLNDQFGVPVKKLDLAGKRGSDIIGIKSGYCRAIGFLTASEVISISEILEGARDIMGYFDYSISGPEMLDDARAQDTEEFQVGLKNRRAFNRHLERRLEGD